MYIYRPTDLRFSDEDNQAITRCDAGVIAGAIGLNAVTRPQIPKSWVFGRTGAMAGGSKTISPLSAVLAKLNGPVGTQVAEPRTTNGKAAVFSAI